MPELYTPAPYLSVYAFCLDDSLPNFKPNQWIEKDRLYKVKFICDALNTDGSAITIINRHEEEIHPSNSMSSFRAERFEIFEIFLN